MFEKIFGLARKTFGLSAQVPEETGPFAGFHQAHEDGVLGEAPYIVPLVNQQASYQGAKGQAREPDDYALGEQTIIPREFPLR